MRGALNPTLLRDQSELGLIQAFVKEEHGVFFGICRGHQLCAVAHGHELIQDIESETTAHSHQKSWHKIQIDRNSMLYQILGSEEIDVNSIHHQSVLPKKRSKLKITAKDKAGITEAMDLRNGLGFTVQSHPELMNNENGTKTICTMVRNTAQAKQNRMNYGCVQGYSKIKL